MGDAARRQLALTIRRGLPDTPARSRRPRFRCTCCGETFRGVRGVMQHQNDKHSTRWPDTLILADQDPPKDVWQGFAAPAPDYERERCARVAERNGHPVTARILQENNDG